MTQAAKLLDIPPSAGHLDGLQLRSQRLIVHGWMFQPGQVFERIDAYLDGRQAGVASPVTRPDLDRALAWATDGRPAAFRMELPVGKGTPGRLDLVGRGAEPPSARLSCLLPSAADSTLPDPPEELARRVAKLHGPAFRAQGLKMFTDLTDQMLRAGINSAGTLLDWGCGCGRVAAYFLTRLPQMKLIGCDIDAEAIDWCRRNLKGEFIHVDPTPPTRLADDAVDLVIACSVLTHLSAADQAAWLREIRRILSPGGWFLASTNAEFMFQMARHRPRWRLRSAWQKLLRFGAAADESIGFRDSRRDRSLDGIAPPGYYRRVYQSRAHTIAMCSKEFEVVDYIECGLNGHQDLVILRRPA